LSHEDQQAATSGRLAPLLDALRDDPVKVEYYRALLEPLSRYDREHHGDLVKSLESYLRHGGNSTRAAEALFLHRNSLRYRLARIRALTGLDVDDADERLALQVALLLKAP
jgi:purine catabolism regulator